LLGVGLTTPSRLRRKSRLAYVRFQIGMVSNLQSNVCFVIFASPTLGVVCLRHRASVAKAAWWGN